MKVLGCLVLVVGLTSGCAGMTESGDGSAAPPPYTTCGHASVGEPGHPVIASGGASLSCFADAVRTCHPASVSVTEFLVDTGTDVVATVEPGTPCRARYVWNSETGNFGGEKGPRSTTDCEVSVDSADVHLHCAGLDDDWPVPAASS